MRAQIMPLTQETVDAYTRTPFVLVIDHLDGVQFTHEELDGLKGSLNAQAVWVSETPIEVGTPLVLTTEQQRALDAHLYAATTAP